MVSHQVFWGATSSPRHFRDMRIAGIVLVYKWDKEYIITFGMRLFPFGYFFVLSRFFRNRSQVCESHSDMISIQNLKATVVVFRNHKIKNLPKPHSFFRASLTWLITTVPTAALIIPFLSLFKLAPQTFATKCLWRWRRKLRPFTAKNAEKLFKIDFKTARQSWLIFWT